MIILVVVNEDENKKLAINAEKVDLKEKFNEETSVEQCADVIADAENSVMTLINADCENNDNTGKLFFYQYI